jgi:hypothetical protein
MKASASTVPLAAFAGGWPAHAHRHCIWIVSPEGFHYHHAFDEVAQALEEAFSELGGSAPITRSPAGWQGRAPIVYGGNLLQDIGNPVLPESSVIINLEPVVPGSLWLNQEYLDVLRRHPVLDYSPRNRDALRRVGIEHAGLLEIGYSPTLTRIAPAEKDIDVLFYGYLSERRLQALRTVAATGLRVVAVHDTYGAERDAVIARARIVLNIHHDERNVFEIVRVSYLLANRICVVSEGQPDDPDVEWLAGGVEFVPIERLADRCVELIEDPARREAVAQAGFERFSSRRQSLLLQRCFQAASVA